MGSSGFRHGQSGQVYNMMVEFDSQNVARWKACSAAKALAATLTDGRTAPRPPRAPPRPPQPRSRAICRSHAPQLCRQPARLRGGRDSPAPMRAASPTLHSLRRALPHRRTLASSRGAEVLTAPLRPASLPAPQFTGKDLLNGQTDGSSFPNGGLRATHRAGAFLTVDPESPPFIMNDTVFIPAVVAAYSGVSLDEKTPLHRAVQSLSKEGVRLLGLLGMKTKGLVNNIGLEQELFLINREAYFKRPDLQFTGRTVMGRSPARGQEMSDHYMAPLSEATPALACMQAIQDKCFKLGIPLRTRHREVAPNQYEFAPLFGPVVSQTDQNLVVMQIIEETAAKHGLAALMQEKPFQGINGSGKHNNWSISTKEGVQLLNPAQMYAKTGNADVFPVVMAALVSGLDKHGDLLRLAIASPGNDFRLGAMEVRCSMHARAHTRPASRSAAPPLRHRRRPPSSPRTWVRT